MQWKSMNYYLLRLMTRLPGWSLSIEDGQKQSPVTTKYTLIYSPRTDSYDRIIRCMVHAPEGCPVRNPTCNKFRAALQSGGMVISRKRSWLGRDISSGSLTTPNSNFDLLLFTRGTRLCFMPFEPVSTFSLLWRSFWGGSVRIAKHSPTPYYMVEGTVESPSPSKSPQQEPAACVKSSISPIQRYVRNKRKRRIWPR